MKIRHKMLVNLFVYILCVIGLACMEMYLMHPDAISLLDLN